MEHRLLELLEIGLIDYWDALFHPVPGQCMNNLKNAGARTSSSKTEQHHRLTFKNLAGAFIVLLVGIGLSLLAFVYELIMASRNRIAV